MRRLLPCMFLLLLAGCSRPPRYNVYVTGYTAGGALSSIPAGSSIAVVENPGAKNPLLEEEIVAKARRALARRGFRTAPPGEADFVVTLRYGADSRVEHGEEMKYAPGQDAVVKDSTGKVVGTVTGSGTFAWEPTTSTTELQWLTLTALEGQLYRQSKPGKPAWIGESKSSGTNLDLRSVLDYLIVPAASVFGHNESQRRSVLRADDPTVRALRVP
jgi:hypothetical protein